MKLLVTGGAGQLGRALVRRAGAHEILALDIDRLDICDAAQVAAHLDGIDVAINAAAYTGVDKAESEPDRAFAINARGAEVVACACAERGVRMLHVSTDYVFDGAGSRPYREDDAVAPLNVYGASKAAGERAVQAAGGIVVRTSWLFGEGGPSFVHTMLRLARERPLLRVVADQHGCPTWADDLAGALLALAPRAELAATYHFCNAEPTTWHGFATAIVEAARRRGPVACERVDAIATADYPTPAKRPMYSILDCARIASLGIVPPTWRRGLDTVVAKELG
ncbi:MAG TPA: dTDP-4-dehydrorhamnose reductase [Kofleriaceae bacterium]|jgi:dTDP-4-dehydrorhamnose reductase